MSQNARVPPSAPLAYVTSMEQVEIDEAKTSAEIDHTMAKIRETTYQHSSVPTRSVHAKSHGLLTGNLIVAPGLPPVLAQGLFAKPATYPVLMRFSTTPGDITDDNVSTPRGLAIKVMGTQGARVRGSENDTTQDFVLMNGPAFQRPGIKGFLMDLKMLEPTTDKAEGAKVAASAVFRGLETVIEAFGGKSTKVISLGGQPKTHILGETFYSQVPVLFGTYIAKIGVFPVSPGLTSLTDAPLDLSGKPEGIRQAVSDHFAQDGGTWEVRVQLCTNTKTMPIEDASVIWPEDESPYVTVATLHVEAQDSWSPAKIAKIDEGMSFSPWHALADHRPLGSVMRARQQAYIESANFRAAHGGKMIKEPASIEEMNL